MTHEQLIEEILKEFDGRFGNFWSKHLAGNVVYGGDITQSPTTWTTVDKESIKSFITTTAQRVREETIEVILTELQSYNNHSDCEPEWHAGFSEAIDKVEELSTLNK